MLCGHFKSTYPRALLRILIIFLRAMGSLAERLQAEPCDQKCGFKTQRLHCGLEGGAGDPGSGWRPGLLEGALQGAGLE
jgi:hypothetical protein